MPDEPEIGGYSGKQSSFSNFVGIILLAFGTAIIVTVGVVAIEKAERNRRNFIAGCIEFQSVERCRTLYSYDRGDLMTKREPPAQ